MNSAVIVKIEYRLIEDQEFQVLKSILYSARLEENIDRTRAGNLHQSKINFNISKICAENELVLIPLKNRKAQFRITDANGVVHLVGNDQFPARLSYRKSESGTPGSFNGYRCQVSCSSPEGSSVS